uniref:Uncharacterized protein n=1 Tax=Plectus sambesii TaxID=2011161 RepID=A0A914W7R1_9BILA
MERSWVLDGYCEQIRLTAPLAGDRYERAVETAMGNRVACGCSTQHPKGFGDTPYSKQVGNNMFRFWAEVFLLAQEGTSKKPGSKWQMVVPKLVPVNLARVQDAPAVVSHVTAYNTKVDKVMDVLLYHPGIEVRRGSDCFVYWSDPQKGLTWGLNFVCPEEANYFADLVCGKTKGILCRRTNSTALPSSRQRSLRSCSESRLESPEREATARASSSKPTVKFAEPLSRSAGASRQTTPVSQTQLNNSQELHASSNSLQFFLTGKRLSHWGTMLQPNPESSLTTQSDNESFDGRLAAQLEKNTTYDNLIGASTPTLPTKDSSDHDENKPPLFSGTARRANKARDDGATPRSGSLRDIDEQASRSDGTYVNTTDMYRLQSGGLTGNSSSSVSSAERVDVVLRQNDKRYPVREAPLTKRSSIHLITGANGRLKNVDNLLGRPDDSGSSLSSSMEGAVGGFPEDITKRRVQSTRLRSVESVVLMKRWLKADQQKIAIVDNESWQQYVIRLRGLTLCLFRVTAAAMTSSSDSTSPESGRMGPPISVELLTCLVTPIPEHPRRQNVFCVSDGTGQALLLQAATSAEVDLWVSRIHTAAALAIARSTSAEVAVRTIKKELDKLDMKLETVAKMLQLSHLPSVGTVSVNQIGDWENELEVLHLHQFALRCYLAAIKDTDGPSCKRVLAAASAHTKSYLSQMNIFTLSAMHAFCSSRAKQNQPSLVVGGTLPSCSSAEIDQALSFSPSSSPAKSLLVQIALPTGQVTVVSVSESDTVAAVLRKATDKVGLKADSCFLMLRNSTKSSASSDCFTPEDNDHIFSMLPGAKVQLHERLVYHVHMSRSEATHLGLTVRANRVSSSGLAARVTAVEHGSPSHRKGLMVGDELLAVNRQPVRTQSSPPQVQRLLQQGETLCLVLRTKRSALPVWLEHLAVASSFDDLKISCADSERSGGIDVLSGTMSAAEMGGCDGCDEPEEPWFSDSCGLLRHKVKYRSTRLASARQRHRHSMPIAPLAGRMNASLMTPAMTTCRESMQAAQTTARQSDKRLSLIGSNANSPKGRMSVSESAASRPSSAALFDRLEPVGSGSYGGGKMGPAERLEKSIFELLETEKAYVGHIDRLIEQYLAPLRLAALLPQSETDRLLSSAQAIARFQHDFLEELQEAAGVRQTSPSGASYATPGQLRNALLRIGGVFLSKSNKFKVYSPFCASHFRTQKLLRQEEKNEKLQAFLAKCNVDEQHACTFESYLIKPVQRVLRYPLFLQQMKTHTCEGTPEHVQVSQALTKMEQVAEYINEMQRVYEEYGTMFALIQVHNASLLYEKRMTFELSDLLMFGHVDWLNPGEENKKKMVTVESLCFVFKRVIVLVPQIERPTKVKKSKASTPDVPMHRLIPIREIEVNGSDIGSTEGRFLWILIHIKADMSVEKVYHLSSRRSDIKQQFLRAIRKAGVLISKEGTPPRTPSTPDDRASVSSPDSGFPQPLSKRAVGGDTSTSALQTRPNSHHSSQSDGGYVSNGELHKKQ